MSDEIDFDHIFPPEEISEIKELLASDPEMFRKRYQVELSYHHEMASKLTRLQRMLEGKSPFADGGTPE